jgi:hypothetical protein
VSKEWRPKLPEYPKARCIICGEDVTAPPFEAVKSRQGGILYMHTKCYEDEQRELKEAGR